MKYIIIPTEVFAQADMQLAERLGLATPRKSVDGSEVIMHVENYEKLFGSAPAPKSRSGSPEYSIYDSGSEELKQLLDSPEWASSEEGAL